MNHHIRTLKPAVINGVKYRPGEIVIMDNAIVIKLWDSIIGRADRFEYLRGEDDDDVVIEEPTTGTTPSRYQILKSFYLPGAGCYPISDFVEGDPVQIGRLVRAGKVAA